MSLVVQEVTSMPISGDPRAVLIELKARVLGLLAKLEPYTEKYNGYTLELTWVRNKVGKRYYYWYLKSKHRSPKSIYIGRSVDIDVLHKFRNRELSHIVARLKRILRLLTELEQLMDTIDVAEQLVKWINEQEQAEQEAKQKLHELRAIQG